MGQNSQSYPALERIIDEPTRAALRLTYDRINEVRNTVLQPLRGTLSPDEKPRGLGQQEAGKLFYATDYNRSYRWTGIAWEDAPGTPSRNSVLWFVDNPNPPIGWVPCDGNRYARSTSDGRTEVFLAPLVADSNGQKAWIRV